MRRSAYELLRHAGWLRHIAVGSFLRAVNGRARNAGSAPHLAASISILIIRLDEIGDFVLTTPLLRAVRERFPAAGISLLVNSKVMALARGCPHVDEVIPYDVVRAPPPLDQLVSLLRARAFAKRRLAGAKFHCAIMPRADNDDAGAAAMAYYARIPLRIGYSETVLPLKRIKNAGYDGFLSHPVMSLTGSHEVEWSLNIGSFAGIPARDRRLELWPSQDARASALLELARFRNGQPVLVALSPGANLDRRRWPVSGFAAVARVLIRERGARVVIVGGVSDMRLAEQLAVEGSCKPGDVLNFAGKLSLDQTASILAECRLFIGNDSGPMHIAAAMGVPCVEISCHPKDGDTLAANSPVRFSPWGVDSVVLQPQRPLSPCMEACSRPEAHCIRQVSVEEVLLAARELLDRGAALPEHRQC